MCREEINKSKSVLIENSLSIIYLTVFFIIALISVQDNFLAKFLIRENGPVESFSIIGYFLAFITAIILQSKGRISFGTGAAVILLTMGLRELDFHDRFTTMSFTKSRFYISDTVPLNEKIIVVIIVLILAWFIGSFFKKQFHPFLAALKNKDKAAILALNGIIFTIISKLLDSTPVLFAQIVEESMEFAIPYFFLAAMLRSTEKNKEVIKPVNFITVQKKRPSAMH